MSDRAVWTRFMRMVIPALMAWAVTMGVSSSGQEPTLESEDIEGVTREELLESVWGYN